jgi:hypothetical protein
VELYLFAVHQFPLVALESDGIGYMRRASGPLFQLDPFHGPGYSWAIRLLSLGTSAPFPAAKLVSLLSGLGLLLAAWRIFLRVSRPPVAATATALLAATPALLFRGVAVMSDMLATALFYAALLTLLRAETPRRGSYALAGALAGLAYLTRYVYLLLLALPLLAVLLLHRRAPGRRRLSACLSFWLAFLIITSPWLIHVYRRTGNPFCNQDHLNIAFEMTSHSKGLSWRHFPSPEDYPNLLAVIRSDPGLFLRTWAGTLLKLPRALGSTLRPIGLLALLGLIPWLQRAGRRGLLLIASLGAYTLAVALTWWEERFLLPLIPLLSLWAASCLELLPSRPRLRVPWRGVAALAMVGALAWHASSAVPRTLAREPLDYRAAVRWLREHAPPDAVVLAAKPHIPFFSGLTGIAPRARNSPLAGCTLQDLPRVLAQVRPTYLVYDHRAAARYFPNLKPLLVPQRNPYPSLLRPVFQIDEPRRLIIYEYLGPSAEEPPRPVPGTAAFPPPGAAPAEVQP